MAAFSEPVDPASVSQQLLRTQMATLLYATVPPQTTPLARNQARICVQPAPAAAAR